MAGEVQFSNIECCLAFLIDFFHYCFLKVRFSNKILRIAGLIDNRHVEVAGLKAETVSKLINKPNLVSEVQGAIAEAGKLTGDVKFPVLCPEIPLVAAKASDRT